MDKTRRRELLAVYRGGLLEDTLPFWTTRCVDSEYGGFMMSLDRDGSLLDTDKSVWQQGRFTWLLARLHNQLGPQEPWLEWALQGAEFMQRFCRDPADGRMWFQVTRDGRPIRKRRYAFSESFAAIAYGELARATGKEQYASLAREAFQRFLSHPNNPAEFEPKFTATRPTRGFGFPMIALGTAQELRQSIELDTANEVIDRSLETIEQYHLNHEHRCVLETASPDGSLIDHFDGRLLNPGHAIEGAWFVLREAEIRDDSRLLQLGCQMLDWMWDYGWDREYGGILYFVDVKGLPVQEYWHDMKFWWPQNEAIIATLWAWKLTGQQRYADWHRQIHDWTYRHFPDPEHGEWYGYLHRDGRVSSRLKGNLWKGPFHLPRMQLQCWQLLENWPNSNSDSAE